MLWSTESKSFLKLARINKDPTAETSNRVSPRGHAISLSFNRRPALNVQLQPSAYDKDQSGVAGESRRASISAISLSCAWVLTSSSESIMPFTIGLILLTWFASALAVGVGLGKSISKMAGRRNNNNDAEQDDCNRTPELHGLAEVLLAHNAVAAHTTKLRPIWLNESARSGANNTKSTIRN
jgi:hypothetical protein